MSGAGPRMNVRAADLSEALGSSSDCRTNVQAEIPPGLQARLAAHRFPLQQNLYFRPLPQGHGSYGPAAGGDFCAGLGQLAKGRGSGAALGSGKRAASCAL